MEHRYIDNCGHEERGPKAHEAAHVKQSQAQSSGTFTFVQEHSRNEKPRDDEENVDAEIAAPPTAAAPVLGWADEVLVAEVVGCDKCGGGCGR